MKPIHLRMVALVMILSGLALLGLENHKTIQLDVNGSMSTVETSAFTVGGLLEGQAILIRSGDSLSPTVDHWLSDGELVRLRRAAQVAVWGDKALRFLTSHERIPANLLLQAGLLLYPGDRVLVNGRVVAVDKRMSHQPALSIQIERARLVELHDGSQTHSFRTTAPTLGQALAENGIVLYASDRIDPPLNTPLLPGSSEADSAPLEAVLQRSTPLTVSLKERVVRFRSAAPTVGEALAEAGLALQGLDYSQPDSSSPLPTDGKLRVVRVQEQVVMEQEPLPFETELVAAPDLELDTRAQLEPGEFGVKARQVRIRYEDGQEVARAVEDEWVAREPKNRVMGYGTKVVLRTLDTPDGPVEYWRAVQMYATSYSPCRIFKDRCDSVTATGAELQKGIAAVTPYWFRYTGGDRVYVPGYGTATVADTGGGIPGRYWIDLGYSDDDYVSWHQTVTVYFLTPVPTNILWILP